MKCLFCNKRCRLLKENEPDYNNYDMTWLCNNHPNRVLHHVRLSKYALRRDRSIQGTERRWTHSSIKWVNDKGQIMVAWYRRDEEYGENVDKFSIFIVHKQRERWQDRYDEIFSLKDIPDFTPENVADKISKYVVFS